MATLVVIAVIASTLVTFAALGGGLGAALAIACGAVAGALTAGLGWTWALRPLRDQLAEADHARDALAAELHSLPGSSLAGGHPSTRATGPRASDRALEALDPARAPAPTDAARAEPGAGGGEVDRVAVAALCAVSVQASLRQAALAFEKVGELEGGGGAQLLTSIGYTASMRAQEAMARLESTIAERAAEPSREPLPLREDLAAAARALAFELGRDVALRFGPDFPAQVALDRVLYRMALTTLVHTVAEVRPDAGEILIEATHEVVGGEGTLMRGDGNVMRGDGNPALRIAVSAAGTPTIADLPTSVGPTRATAALASLLQRAQGRLGATFDGAQLSFSLPATRHKRVTGTTLYGLGALSGRTALVIDPRPIGRVTICEQLATWRLQPTGVASMAEAVAAATRAKQQRNERFDIVVVCAPALDQADWVRDAVANLGRLTPQDPPKFVSLEEIDALALETTAAEAAGPVIRRLARPPNPSELIEALTTMLAPAPVVQVASAKTGTGLSVIVAEDNLVNQAMIAKMLERRGHTVRVVANGADLLDRLLEGPDAYDAVLTDIQMPVMDGYEAAAVIRMREAQSGRGRIPIIAVTAHAMGGEREKCLEAGMDGYLAKPVTDRDLTHALDTYVLVRRTAEAAAAEQARAAAAAAGPAIGGYDRAHVLELAAGDMEFLHGLVEIFAESAPRLIDQVAAHIAAGEHEGVFKKAHQLKGSIGNFGAHQARSSAATIEDLGHQKDLAGAAELLPRLRADVEELIVGLRALAAELRR